MRVADPVMRVVALAVLMQLLGAVGPFEFVAFTGKPAQSGGCQHQVDELHHREL